MAAAAAVVIEMPAQDAALPYSRVLVNACTEGLRERGPCALEDSTSESAYAVVIVSWEGQGHTAAKIEVGVRHGSRADWVARHVAFNASDAEVERWRSVGLIIATLVEQAGGDRKPEPPAATPAPQDKPPAPVRPAPAQAEVEVAEKPASPLAPTRNAWLLDGAFELARGTGNGLGALGGLVRGSRQVGSTAFLVTGSLRYETQPTASNGATARVGVQWAWAGAGVAVATDPARPLLFEARLEPTLGWVQATAQGSSSAKSGVLFGAREGVSATWWWAWWLGIAAGVEAVETTQSATVRVSTNGATSYTPVTTEQWIGWSATLGLRFRTD